ncbi:MAG: AMP-dependent synthetase/ligase [Thermodesulfobacteriota bacterium]
MTTTINSLIQDSIKNNRSRTALLKKSEAAGGYEPITYESLGESVRGLALGLSELGVKKGDPVALISENRPEWTVADLGILHAGAVSVALFPTLPAEQVSYSLRDSASRVVILSNENQLKKVLAWMGTEPAGKTVIMMDKKGVHDPGVLGFTEVINRGSRGSDAEFSKLWQSPKSSERAGIIYTSGTTGTPVGAALTHGNFVSSVVAGVEAVDFKAGHAMVSFLPLNHVFARLVDHYLPLSIGAAVAYAGSARDIRGVVKDMRPQYMTVVPRVLEMYREGILHAFEQGPTMRRGAFNKFFAAGLERLRLVEGRGEPQPGLDAVCKEGDALVFSKIREELGLERLRFFISGGAPLSLETERFFRVLGIEILEGYGLTETAALVSVNRPGRAVPGTVGPPVKGVEVKLTDDGEILVKGRNIMEGYWKRPGQTAKAIDAEGWLYTGDLGEVDEAGCLKIKGRLKEIIVLTTGKNVSPMPIEERLRESPFISQIIVVGDNRNLVAAIIVPDFGRLKVWMKGMESALKASEEAASSGGTAPSEGTEPSDEEVAGNPHVKELIRAEIKRLSGALADFERVHRFALMERAFTVDEGELTPTLKVRRKVVLEKYGDVVESLYR